MKIDQSALKFDNRKQYDNDPNSADQFLSEWEKTVDQALKVISQPVVSTEALCWLGALASEWRSQVCYVITYRNRLIDNLGSHGLARESALRRDRGYTESSENLSSFKSKNTLNNIVDLAMKTKKTAERIDRLFDNLSLLFLPSIKLAEERINTYKQTKPGKRKKGENMLISFLITWVNHGKWDKDLSQNKLFKWCEGKAGVIDYVRSLCRSVKNYRGAVRTVGEPQPSWALCCSDFKKWDREKVIGRDTTSTENRRRYTAARYNRRIGVNGDTGCAQNDAIAYRAYREKGIKQNTIARWMKTKGVDYNRIYPRVDVVDQPQIIEREGLIYYVCLSKWETRSHYSWDRKENGGSAPQYIVWCDGMADVFHIWKKGVESAEQAVESSAEALRLRAEADRAEAEARRLAELDQRKQTANLVRKCRSIPTMRREDSYRVGNCSPGTSEFIRHLGLSDREEVTGAEIARKWKEKQYTQRSYFQRVILSLSAKQVEISK